MYAVEFQAPIENSIVHIHKKYQEIQDNKKTTFIAIYNHDKVTRKKIILMMNYLLIQIIKYKLQ